ncbi:MAG: hypothetical protein QOE77_808 [Blastocatellia bacterium]|nr:hypothetical protein [Blastocatellia bacterium]
MRAVKLDHWIRPRFSKARRKAGRSALLTDWVNYSWDKEDAFSGSTSNASRPDSHAPGAFANDDGAGNQVMKRASFRIEGGDQKSNSQG